MVEFLKPDEVFLLQQMYLKNDLAHQWNHIEEVLKASKIICERLSIPYDKIIELAICMHDLMKWNEDNEPHQIAGYKNVFLIWSESLLPTLDECTIEEVKHIAICVREHRAKGHEGKFTSPQASVVAASDAGILNTNLEEVEKRIQISIQYSLAKGKTPDKARKDAVRHLHEKYGKGGYAYNKFSTLYKEAFANEIIIQQNLVEEYFNLHKND